MNDLELARQIFQTEGAAFVLVLDGHVLAQGTREGIGELLAAVKTLGVHARGASLADKIVGKAVAMVAAFANLHAVYSPLASEGARNVLAPRQIELIADRVVPLIMNKRGDGPCPMERLTLPLEEPEDAVAALEKFVAARAA